MSSHSERRNCRVMDEPFLLFFTDKTRCAVSCDILRNWQTLQEHAQVLERRRRRRKTWRESWTKKAITMTGRDTEIAVRWLIVGGRWGWPLVPDYDASERFTMNSFCILFIIWKGIRTTDININSQKLTTTTTAAAACAIIRLGWGKR